MVQNIAAGIVGALFVLSRLGVNHTSVTTVLGFLLWVAVLGAILKVILVEAAGRKYLFLRENTCFHSRNKSASKREPLSYVGRSASSRFFHQEHCISRGIRGRIGRLQYLISPRLGLYPGKS